MTEAYEVRVAAIRQETPTVKSFVLEVDGFSFLPGQYLDLFIDVGGERLVGGYSITSSPFQKGSVGLAVKRIESARAAAHLHDVTRVGDTLAIVGPGGDFCYQREMGDSIVLIAGGIGITPFMSMLRYVHEGNLDVGVTLLYSAKTPSEFVIYDELKAMSAENPRINCIFTVTQPQLEPWEGRTGRIDLSMLQESGIDKESLFYICGPSEMPQSISAMLREWGIDDSRIRTEKW